MVKPKQMEQLTKEFKAKDLNEKYSIHKKIENKHIETHKKVLKSFRWSFIAIIIFLIIYILLYTLTYFKILNISFALISEFFNFITLAIATISLVISGLSLYSISDHISNLKSDLQHEEVMEKLDNLENKVNEIYNNKK